MTGGVALGVLFAMTPSGSIHAATFNVTDDLTVSGTGGTSSDPDAHVKGYSSFATTPSNAGVVTSGAGNLYIQGSAEFDGSLYSSDGIWKSDGSLGIGTTNPGAKLAVGNDLFQVSATGDISKINNVAYTWPASQGGAGTALANTGGTLTWSAAAGVSGWYDAGTLVYTSLPAYKLGIGFASPAAKLDIRGAGTGASTWALRIANTLGTDKVVIQDNGNVGLGTTAPSEKLHLQDGTLLVDKPSSYPKHVASITDGASTLLTGAESIYVSGKYAYVASYDDDGVAILDISNPASPAQVGSIADSGAMELLGAEDIVVAGRYAYVCSYSDSGLEILDISNPSSPTHVGSLTDTAATAMSGAEDIYVAGRYAYIAGYLDNGIAIIDVSNPASPVHAASITDAGSMELGGAASVYVAGRYAYVASYVDDGLEVLDVSNPVSPFHVGYITDTASTALDGAFSVHVSGRYAYVAARTEDGVGVIDISNPASPLSVGEIYDAGLRELFGPRGIYVAGKYAYVASTDDNGVEILDVSIPSSPSHIGAITDAGTTTALAGARGIHVSGRYVYVASYSDDGIEILDIGGADVHALTAGTIETGGLTVNENVDIGNNLYVRGGINAGPGGIHTDAGLSAGNTSLFWGNVGVGMTNPAYKLDVLGDIRASGNLYGTFAGGANGWQDGGVNVYLTVPTDKLGIGTTLPAAKLDLVSAGTTLGFALRISDTLGRDKLVILDNGNVGIGTTAPGAMLQAGTSPSTGLFVTAGGNVGIGATAGSTKLYVAGAVKMVDGTEGLSKVLTSDANGLAQWTTPTGGPGGSGGWYDGGTLVYTSLPAYKLGIGLTNPAAKLDIRSAGTGVSGFGFRVSDTLANDKVVILDNGNVGVGTTAPSEKLHIQDGTLKVDTPQNMRQIGGFVTTATAPMYGIYVSGRYAYAADYSSGLRVIDISVPSSPQQVGMYDTSGAVEVWVHGRYAYVADGTSGLRVIDVSVPASPQQESRFATTNASGLAVSGRYAYVADWTAGLRIVDISVPSSPVQAGIYDTTNAAAVYVSGRYAYVADYNSGVRVIDVSFPASPIEAGRRTTSQAQGIYVSGRYSYVADDTAGIKVIDISMPSSPVQAAAYDTTNALSLIVMGRYLYVADRQSGLVILDVSVPSSPVYAGIYDTTLARWVTLSGHYAYVADDASGLRVLDIGGADVHALAAGTVETGSLTVDDNVDIGNSLYVRGGINAGPGGIHTDAGLSAGNTSVFWGNVGIGMTNPAYKLDVLGDIRATGNIYGTYAGSVGGWTDGGANVYTGTLTDNVGLGTTAPGALLEIRSAGTGATTMALRIGDTAQAMRLAVLDMGNVGIGQTVPLQLLQVGTSPYPGLTVKWDGNVGVGLTDPGAKLDIRGKIRIADGTQANTYVFTSNAAGVGSWQVASGGAAPWNLTGTSMYLNTTTDKVGVGLASPVAKLDIRGAGTGASTWALRIADTLAADKIIILDSGNVGIGTTAPAEKLHIQDGTLKIDKPSSYPKHLGSIADAGSFELGGARAVYVSGRYAYVAGFDDDGIEILDVSNPASPAHVGSITDSGSMALNGARGIRVAGRYAYATGSHESGLEILDVSNPSSPVHVGSLFDSGSMALYGAYGVYVSGRYAYVTGELESGLEIVDISVPSSPIHAGSIADSGSMLLGGAEGVYVSGRYAYVAGYDDDGLEIIDISNPASPLHVGAIADGGSRQLNGASGVYVSGKYAYVAAYIDDGINIIDVSNPSNPVFVSALADAGTMALNGARNIVVSGRYAYVTGSSDSGLAIIDVSEPTSPVHVNSLTDNGSAATALAGAEGLYVSGRYAYVASRDDSGFAILDLGGADVHALTAGTIETGGLTVHDNADIGNNLFVRGGINAGPGGIFADGVISSAAGAFASGNVGIGVGVTIPSKARLEIMSSNTATAFYLSVAGGKLTMKKPAGGTNCAVCGPANNSVWFCSNSACP